MFNPIPPNDTGSDPGRKRRVLGKTKSSVITERISALVQKAYGDALKSESIVLSDQALDDVSNQMKTDG